MAPELEHVRQACDAVERLHHLTDRVRSVLAMVAANLEHRRNLRATASEMADALVDLVNAEQLLVEAKTSLRHARDAGRRRA